MKKQTARTAMASITLACTLAFTGAPARIARAVTITGHDHYVGESADDAIRILSIDGANGGVVYCRVSDNGELIADRLAYRLGEDNGEPMGSGDLTGVVTATLDELDPTHAYGIEVYADRDETQRLYSGELRAVYGVLEGTDEPVVVAWRTSNSDEDAWMRGEEGEKSRKFHAPETVSFGSDSFRLVSPEPVGTAPLTYSYVLDGSIGEVVTGSVTYVDDRGEVIERQKIEGIAKGQPKVVSIPEVIAADAGYYRPVHFERSLQASYPGVRDFTIRCKRLPDAVAERQGFYVARINLVGADGAVLATDSVPVAGTVRYGAPSRLYKGVDVVDTYVLSPDQSVELGEGNVLVLEPTTEGVQDGVRTFDIAYDVVRGQSEVTWTIVAVNGAADPRSPERVIGSRRLAVSPENPVATYAPVERIDIAGTTFVPVTKGEVSYGWNSGKDPVTWVYYVPEGHVPEEAYDVTVNYVNVATGETIGSKTYAVSPEDREDQTFVAPERIDGPAGGYVRLDGQETGIRHGYYSPYRTYTAYYRGVNDNLHRDTVVTKIRVEYADGEQAYAVGAAGAASPADAAATGGSVAGDSDGPSTGDGSPAAGAGALATSIPTSDGLSTIDGSGGAPIVTNDGEPLDIERIGDGATPLARGVEGARGEYGLLGGEAVVAALCAGVGLVVLLGVWFALRRGRRDRGSTQDS